MRFASVGDQRTPVSSEFGRSLGKSPLRSGQLEYVDMIPIPPRSAPGTTKAGTHRPRATSHRLQATTRTRCNPHAAAGPQRGRNTLVPVAGLGITKRSWVSARFSGRKKHCAQISFVLYQAMAERPCRGKFASRRTGPPAQMVQGAGSGPSLCAGGSGSRQIHFIVQARFTKRLHLSDPRI